MQSPGHRAALSTGCDICQQTGHWLITDMHMQGPFSMKDMRAWLRSGYLKDTNWVAHVDNPSQEWMLKDVLAAQRIYPEAWLNDPGKPCTLLALAATHVANISE